MVKIEYPAYHPKIKKEPDKELIFDGLRKIWVVLTPEEWVRQNLLQYLVQVLKYPAKLIAVEKEIKIGELRKRFDIVVYDRQAMPRMIIECKEMNVPLTPAVLNQVLRYNIPLQVNYLVISNGSHCYAFENKEGQLTELNTLPSFSSFGPAL